MKSKIFILGGAVHGKKKIGEIISFLQENGFTIQDPFLTDTDEEMGFLFKEHKNISMYVFLRSLNIVASVVLGDIRYLAEFEINDKESLVSFLRDPQSHCKNEQ